jgi:hypothetical protein
MRPFVCFWERLLLNTGSDCKDYAVEEICLDLVGIEVQAQLRLGDCSRCLLSARTSLFRPIMSLRTKAIGQCLVAVDRRPTRVVVPQSEFVPHMRSVRRTPCY